MKGSAEIKPNINSTKINSAWLLWLIQKQLFSNELRSGERWNRTSSALGLQEPLATLIGNGKMFLKGNTENCNSTSYIALQGM